MVLSYVGVIITLISILFLIVDNKNTKLKCLSICKNYKQEEIPDKKSLKINK